MCDAFVNSFGPMLRNICYQRLTDCLLVSTDLLVAS